MLRKLFGILPLLGIAGFFYCAFAASPVQAQRSRASGMFQVLGDEEVIAGLKLTEEEREKIGEFAGTARPDRDFYQQWMSRVADAGSDDEKSAIRAQMNLATTDLTRKAENDVRQLIGEDRFALARQLYFQKRGVAVLQREDLQSELNFTDEQKTQLTSLLEERSNARRSLGFRATEEQVKQFEDEWAPKITEVLNADQQTQWTAITTAETPVKPPAYKPLFVADKATEKPADAVATAPMAVPADDGTPDDAPADPADDTGPPTGDVPVGDVVLSFDSQAGSKPANEEKPFSFTFQYAPWEDVLDFFAKKAGWTLDLDTKPPGTFSYRDDNQYTATEALDVLNGYLLQKGFLLVNRDKFLVVVKIDEGVPPNLVPNVSLDDLPQRGKNEIMSVVIELKGMDVAEAATEVEGLLGPQGRVIGLSASNSLVVTDIGTNLRRVHALLKNVITKESDEAVSFKSYPLNIISASEAERVIRAQLGLGSTVTNVSASYDNRRSSSPTSSDPNLQVFADGRTRSLLITASAKQHKRIEEVLKVIDTDKDAQGREIVADDQTPVLRVYKVTSTDAGEVTKTLDAIWPGIVVNEDRRAGTIHIMATPKDHEEIAEMVRQLDGQGGGMQVGLVPLPINLDPLSVAGTLRSLFSSDGEDAPVVEADLVGRRLMIRGTSDQILQVKTLITQLAESTDPSLYGGRQTGPVRQIPLGGRDPRDMLPLIEKVWAASNSPTPIRVVVPQKPEPIKERITPSAAEPADQPQDTRTQPRSSDGAPTTQLPGRKKTMQLVSMQKEIVDDAVDAGAVGDPAPLQPRTTAGAGGQPLIIAVDGDTLMLMGNDDKALNQLEDMVTELSQIVQPKVSWTVFYLKSADVTETSTILQAMYPSSSLATSTTDDGLMSSLTSGITSFGSGLMSASGLNSLGGSTMSLKFITDTRSNSLLVSGPPGLVWEIEEVLKVLDTDELPESLRQRVPRPIEVKYADIEDVASIVRELYKDYLTPSNGGQINPLQLLAAAGGNAGGRNSRGRQQQQQEVRMTLAVDERASQLLISSSEDVFRQVSELVERLDKSAQEARRTVRIVTLDNADAYIVQQALGSVMPRVQVSTTGGARAGRSSSSSQSTPTPQPNQGGGGADAETIQRIMEFRARQEASSRGGNNGGGQQPSGRPSGQPGGNRGGR